MVLWLGLSLLSSICKHNMLSYYGWVCRCCHPSVSTICGRIMVCLLLLSSVSKHNLWSYYGWVCRCSHPFVSKIFGRIMVGFFLLSSVSNHNMIALWLVCCCCHLSVNRWLDKVATRARVRFQKPWYIFDISWLQLY